MATHIIQRGDTFDKGDIENKWKWEWMMCSVAIGDNVQQLSDSFRKMDDHVDQPGLARPMHDFVS